MAKQKNYKLKSELGIKTARELTALIKNADDYALSPETLTSWLIEDDKRLQRFLELVCEGTIPQIDNLTFDELEELVSDFFGGLGAKLLNSLNTSRILSHKEMLQELLKNQIPMANG